MASVSVTIQRASVVHTLPNIWDADALRRVMEALEFDDIDNVSDNDCLDMASMVLQDAGHQEAGECVLEVVFGSAMSAGVRQNLVDDLQDEEAWQDFSVVAQQRGIFVAVILMHHAFPNRYPSPDATRLQAQFAFPASSGITLGACTSADLLRMLSAGMSDGDVLHRLYEDELKGGRFDDADAIIWFREDHDATSTTLISSRQWMGSLRTGMSFAAKHHS